MRDKCLNCPDYLYVTYENKDKIRYRCDFQDAICKLNKRLKKVGYINL